MNHTLALLAGGQPPPPTLPGWVVAILAFGVVATVLGLTAFGALRRL